jgi:hypothetical protein
MEVGQGPNWGCSAKKKRKERRGPIECLLPPFHPRTETDPVSETSCFLVSRIPDEGKVQKKNSNSVLYTIVGTLQNPHNTARSHYSVSYVNLHNTRLCLVRCLRDTKENCLTQSDPFVSYFSTNFAEKRRSLGRYSSLAD